MVVLSNKCHIIGIIVIGAPGPSTTEIAVASANSTVICNGVAWEYGRYQCLTRLWRGSVTTNQCAALGVLLAFTPRALAAANAECDCSAFTSRPGNGGFITEYQEQLDTLCSLQSWCPADAAGGAAVVVFLAVIIHFAVAVCMRRSWATLRTLLAASSALAFASAFASAHPLFRIYPVMFGVLALPIMVAALGSFALKRHHWFVLCVPLVIGIVTALLAGGAPHLREMVAPLLIGLFAWSAGLALLIGPVWLLNNKVRSWWLSFLLLLLGVGMFALGPMAETCYCQCRENAGVVR